MPNQSTLTGLRRGLDILNVLALQPEGLPFGELRDSLPGCAAAPLSRVLKVLIATGMVVKSQHDNRYRAGELFEEMARNLLLYRSRDRLLAPLVTSLAQESGESAAYFEFTDDGMMLMTKHEMPNSFHYIPEHRVNRDLLHHGFAHSVLAYLPEAEIELRLNGGGALDASLHRYLDTCKNERVCIERGGDKEGWTRIAAPVFGPGTAIPLGAIGISLVTARFGPRREELTTLVRHHGSEASRRCGGAMPAER